MAQVANSRKPLVVKVRHLDSESRFRIRPLPFEELHEVVLLSRQTRWYGNREVQDLIVKYGLLDPPEDPHFESDMYLRANIVREIWLATLKEFRRKILTLLPICEEQHRVPAVRRYRYGDLATPGLIAFIWRDMQKIEYLDELQEIFLESYVTEFHDGEKLLTPNERKAFVSKHADKFVPFVLEALGFDKSVLNRRPIKFFEKPSEKLFLATTLAQTLDWVQYSKLLSSYNSILDELLYRSRRLGGGDVRREESHLMSGMAGFFALVQPPRRVPFGVLMAALNDVVGKQSGKVKNQSLLSTRDQRILLSMFKESLTNHRQAALETAGKGDEAFLQVLLPLVEGVGKKVNQDHAFVERLCQAYRGEYMQTLEEKEARVFEEFRAEVRSSVVPDGFILVEGPSDKIYLEACLEMVGDDELFLKIEDCEGKDGVLRRFREITSRHAYLGSVLAVLDGDADKQLKDIGRIRTAGPYADAVKFDEGEIEDQIPIELHVQALNLGYPDGEDVLLEDVQGKGPMRSVLPKVLWERKRAAFSKASHAAKVAELIQDTATVPPVLLKISKSALDLARRRSRELPGVESRVSFDRMARKLARWLQ